MLRYFEAWLLRLMGYFPDLSRCANCRAAIDHHETTFVTVEGAPRCLTCSAGRGEIADAESRRLIAEMFRSHPKEFAEQEVSARRLEQIGEMNYQIIRHALERDLRSRLLLKQLAQS